MRIALDTNAYKALCQNNSHIVKLIQQAEEIIFPFVVLAELRAGFAGGNQATKNERNLNRFLQSTRVSTFYADEQTTHHYAHIFNQLKKQGTPIPTNDIWIAAITIQHNLVLVTLDSDFDRLPQLLRG
jgi:tRNA(fMet)-specific endonuclease VapC